MRRLQILFFWIFVNRNNVSFRELIQFLTKPRINSIAKQFIENIELKEDYEVKFKTLESKLFWPKNFSIDRLDQVIAETFDPNDWHFYQKEQTKIEKGEILLDIGTAEGLFPLTVVDICSHIYMVEPSTTFHKCLNKTFSNHLDKVTIFNTAIGNEDGTITFNEDSLDGMISDVSTDDSQQMSIQKVDTLFKNGEKITYLKADIEGFEAEMLKGAEQTIKRNKPKIAITTYHTQNEPNEIIDIITGFVPEYKYYVKGIYEKTPKPVMIHFWI
jgi:FkbM family methyltransferase